MVSPDTARTAVGILGNIIALGLFLSPISTFVKIWKKGDVEKYSPLPYLAAVLNCMLWVLYGLPLVHPHSLLLVTINGAGLLIELSYMAVFLLCSRDANQRRKVVAALAVEFLFAVSIALLVILLAHTHQTRSLVVGCLCVLFCCIMYAAPLSIMRMVVRTRSVEYMPFYLSLASFANGACWTAYALIRFDLFIIIPNRLGTILGLGQLILYATFYKSTKTALEERNHDADHVRLADVVVSSKASSNENVSLNENVYSIKQVINENVSLSLYRDAHF